MANSDAIEWKSELTIIWEFSIEFSRLHYTQAEDEVMLPNLTLGLVVREHKQIGQRAKWDVELKWHFGYLWN